MKRACIINAREGVQGFILPARRFLQKKIFILSVRDGSVSGGCYCHAPSVNDAAHVLAG